MTGVHDNGITKLNCISLIYVTQTILNIMLSDGGKQVTSLSLKPFALGLAFCQKQILFTFKITPSSTINF